MSLVPIQPFFFLDASLTQTQVLQEDGKEHVLTSCVGYGNSAVTPEQLLQQLTDMPIQKHNWNNWLLKPVRSQSDQNASVLVCQKVQCVYLK